MSCARIFPSLVKALGWRVNEADYGSSTPALLASYDLDSQSWRTLERSLFEGSIEYSGALPRSGTMRNGKIYAPPMSERPTAASEFGLLPTPSATEYGTNQGGGMGRVGPVRPSLGTMARKGLWPTPAARDWRSGCASEETLERNSRPLNEVVRLWPTPCARDHFPAHTAEYVAKKKAEGHGMSNLNDAVKLWPTPRTAGMCGGTGNWNQLKEKCENIEEARKMGAGNGGQLSPDWVEWLMNYPIGWTNLDAKSSRIAEPFSPEPDIPRVANSVKERVNRLKCLGNSIVPQIAELIFRQIKQL